MNTSPGIILQPSDLNGSGPVWVLGLLEYCSWFECERVRYRKVRLVDWMRSLLQKPGIVKPNVNLVRVMLKTHLNEPTEAVGFSGFDNEASAR